MVFIEFKKRKKEGYCTAFLTLAASVVTKGVHHKIVAKRLQKTTISADFLSSICHQELQNIIALSFWVFTKGHYCTPYANIAKEYCIKCQMSLLIFIMSAPILDIDIIKMKILFVKVIKMLT